MAHNIHSRETLRWGCNWGGGMLVWKRYKILLSLHLMILFLVINSESFCYWIYAVCCGCKWIILIFIKFIGLIGLYVLLVWRFGHLFTLFLNITCSSTFLFLSPWTCSMDFNSWNVTPCSYVPMFGETEYDPVQQYASISIDEQLEALSAAVKAGKASGIVK